MYQDIIIPDIGSAELSRAFKAALEDNECQFRGNREMQIDFYFSQQTDKDEYLKNYFNRETDPNKDQDYPHNLILSQLNITAKLIDKKAKTYIKQPVRLVDGVPNERYDELLLSAGIKTATKLLDRLTWLLGDHCVVLIADKNTKKLRILQPPYYRPVFASGNTIDPVAVAYPIGMRKNKRGQDVEAWEYWDAENHKIIEHQSWEEIETDKNVHGVFNVLFTHRMKPFRGHWTRDAQDLVDTNRDINIALTSINNALRYQGFPILAAVGVDEKDAGRVKVGFDKVLTVSAPTVGGEGTTVSLEFIYPNVQWDQLMGVIKTRIEMLASTWNVDIRWEISGDLASGVALKILSVDNRDDLNEMAELYEEFFEVPLFEKIGVMSKNIAWMSEIAGGVLTLDWPDEETIESPAERSARLKTDIELNLTNPVDELISANPDLSEEAAVRKYLRNRNINGLSRQAGISVEDVLRALEADESELGTILEPEKPEEVKE